MTYSESQVATNVIKQISGLKHFHARTIKDLTDIYLETRKLEITPEERISLDQRITTALGALGYQTHLGVAQTVPTLRNK